MRLTTAPRLGRILTEFADWPLGWVYCIRDQTGAIVYIGATDDLDERITAHKSGLYESSHQVSLRLWIASNVNTFDVLSTHQTMPDARHAERDEIYTRKPRFNDRGNPWHKKE